MTKKIKVTVLSAGWGAALAVMANKKGADVTLWSPFDEEINLIRKHGEHRKLLPGVAIPPSIYLTTDISCVENADIIIVATPSFALQETAEKMKPYIKKDTPVVCASKGLESNTHRRFSQILSTSLPGAKIAVMSGPSHAEEVGRGEPTSIICASDDVKVAEYVQEQLTSPNFRIYVNTDVVGVELGGALKNVIALSAGVLDGMGKGDNAKAALMTRGLAEIARLGVAMGAKGETFMGLSGMGDLIVTCSSQHSRNRRAGVLIGQGYTPEQAVTQVGTVEGYHAASAACSFAKQYNVEMPISEQCYKVCYEGVEPAFAIKTLLGRPHKHEYEDVWDVNGIN